MSSTTIEMAVTKEGITKAQVKTISLSKLKLDPDNVRFKHLPVRMSDAEIEDYIWNEPDTRELYREILASRGLTEKPLIDANNVVKEGNRRIVCLRKLSKRAHTSELDPDITSDKFDNVQCLVLTPDVPQKAIDIYLARVHVKGKKKWATFNKSRHIYNLYKLHEMSYDEIREYLGMGKATVIRMVDVFKATENYGKKHPDDKEWYRKFTYFDELYKKRDLKEWRKDEDNVDKFAEWVYDGKFNDVRDVRNLPEVINDKEALAKLEKEGIDRALEVVANKDPSITSGVFRNIKIATDTLRNIPRQEFIASARDGARLKMLQELKGEVDSLLKDIEAIKPKNT